jgi:hypothetical protein
METIRSGFEMKTRPGNSTERLNRTLRTTVHGCACCTLLVLAFVLGVIMNGTSAFAAVDKAQASITDWNGVGTQAQPAYYADVSDSNKVKKWNTRSYHASFEATPALNHNAKEGGGFLQHRHHQEEYSASADATQADADKYWDARFPMADRIESATKQHQTCHEWALTKTSNATGTYTYHLALGGVSEAINDALDSRGTDSNQVEAGDLLVYTSTTDHSTYVDSTRSDGSGGNEPKKIKWKWLASGIYEYTTPTSTYEFNTPYCTGTPVINTAVESQSWTEDLDYEDSSTVMGPD